MSVHSRSDLSTDRLARTGSWLVVRGRFAIAALGAALLLSSCASSASGKAGGAPSAYPSHQIEITVPFATGSATDVSTRVLARAMSHVLRVPVVVSDVPGGGTAPGVASVMSQPADGYHVLFETTTTVFGMASGIVKHSVNSFDYVGIFLNQPYGLVVPRNSRFTTLNAFLTYAKDHPGVVSVAGIGPKSPSAEFTSILGASAGAHLNYIPTSGGSHITTDLLGGVADAGVGSLSNYLTYLKSGAMRLLFVGSKSPYPGFAGIPNATTAHINDLVRTWFGLVVRAGTPSSRVVVLQQAMSKALKSATWLRFVASQHEKTDYISGGTFRVMVQQDLLQARSYMKKAQ